MKNYKERFDFKTFVRCGMLTALACVLTMVPQIPTGTGGYVHFGDSIIYVASAFLGPICGSSCWSGWAFFGRYINRTYNFCSAYFYY